MDESKQISKRLCKKWTKVIRCTSIGAENSDGKEDVYERFEEETYTEEEEFVNSKFGEQFREIEAERQAAGLKFRVTNWLRSLISLVTTNIVTDFLFGR